MKKYEFTVILFPTDEMKEKGLEIIKSRFGKSGVEITKQEDLGLRTLAYPIKKQDKGHYVYYEMEADPQSINQMSDEFLLEGSILKFLFVASKN